MGGRGGAPSGRGWLSGFSELDRSGAAAAAHERPGGAGHHREQHARPEAERERLTARMREACRERLRYEWRQLNYCYLRERLRPPSIEVEPMTARWGSWSARTRTIALAERLVTGYRWESVVEVLKHEVAHQVVDELLRPGDVLPHGEAFRRACAMLAADPRASGDGGIPLEGPRAAAAGPERPEDARLRRVRRLLALADSPNVHEAEAALAKANELLLKYNIDLGRSDAERTYMARLVGEPMRRRPAYLKVLAGILSQHFFVEAIWVETYDVRAMEALKVLEVLGAPHNVELAAHTYHELLRSAGELWRKHRRAHGGGDRYRRKYIEGVLMGFSARLERERAALAAERSLVWLGDPGLDAFYRRRHPRIGRETVSIGGTAAYAAGCEAGAALRLRRALREQAAESGRKLSFKR